MPSPARIIDGRAIAARILSSITATCTRLQLKPHLCVLQVGDRPDSNLYIRAKEKAAHRTQTMGFSHIKLPLEASQTDLLNEIMLANQSPTIHGIIIQLPLPVHINTFQVLNAVAPAKDVDSFSVHALGLMAQGLEPLFIPPTAAAIMHVLEEHSISLKGKIVAVVGRGKTVGLPLSLLMNHAKYAASTVIVCHSETVNPQALVRLADVVVVATGVPGLVDASWIKAGAVVIDVGSVGGDVDFGGVVNVASVVSPVPGGVGPVTVAKLLENTLKGAIRSLEG